MDDEIKKAMAVVYVSTDDRETWHPVKPDIVPDWVKNPDVMANLLGGECAQHKDTGLAWYAAQRVETTPEGEQLQ